uniref:Uncharacterized protein n=1 Tax=Peronospora matthiolae TaxID=2874970 RepID=A0AAV1UUU6_9STRA
MPLSLSPCVFLAFDDISRAGKHVLSAVKFHGTNSCPVPHSDLETLLPIEMCPYVQLYQYPNDQATSITVNTAKLPETKRWEVVDALVSAMSEAEVETLTILAAAHLPYAKDGGLQLCAADPAWETKEPWLAALLHWISVEQWPCTHLLLAKGHKPGRDLAGTYEAVEALSRAVQLLTDKVTIDDSVQVQQRLAQEVATKGLTTETALTASDEHLALLYR